MRNVSKALIKFGDNGATGMGSSKECGRDNTICNILSGLLISILHGKRMSTSKDQIKLIISLNMCLLLFNS